MCPGATAEPEPCSAGGYCAGGNPLAEPCPAGTWSNVTGLASALECKPCDVGSSSREVFLLAGGRACHRACLVVGHGRDGQRGAIVHPADHVDGKLSSSELLGRGVQGGQI